MSKDRLIVGVGSLHGGDDAVGIETARRISGSQSVEVSDCSELIDLWDGLDQVVVVDAMVSGDLPGSVRKIDAIESLLPAGGFRSTHAFDLAAAVSMSRALGRLPRSLIVYGIEAEDLTPGSPMTPAVVRAMESVIIDIEESC